MEQDRQTRREGDASRQRGWSVATDGSLDVDTKRRLLDSMPHYDYSIDDGTAHQKQSSSAAAGSSSAGRKRASSDMSDSSSSDMFGSDEAGGEKKKSKRARHHQHHDGRIPEAVAQGRLSKWAARLFDPDRPRGLIETPQVIPLNDEFLQAFGQRERAFDKARGVTDLEIDKEIHDDDDDKGTIQAPVGVPKAVNNGENKGVKVKISNLKFTTSSKALLETCCAFGTVLNLNLLMEEENPSNENDNQQLNKGRAYVVFETEEGAKACIDGLEVLDGRPLRVELASSGGATGRSSMGKSLSSSRYYDKDISTKCFRCGEVGHREAECTNPARAKPCPICAGLDHDIKNCPIKPVCYNCGAPGHVSKNCTQPRGLPPKSICTVCFQSGHNKFNCRQSYRDASSISQAAVCMVCGQVGHYLCEQLQWFFGVNGVTCSNCGQSQHIGQECRRPKYEFLDREPELAKMEIERVQEEENNMARGRRDRRGRTDFPDQRRRVQSVPPSSRYRPKEPRSSRR